MGEVGTVMGWGYQGRAVEELASTLKIWCAHTLVDVRLNPVSRKPGFSKRALARLCEDLGVGYEHLPALGNPRDNRDGFADPDSQAGREAHQRFSTEVLDTSDAQTALERVDDLARSGLVVLLCFEASERECHRSLILAALRRQRRTALV